MLPPIGTLSWDETLPRIGTSRAAVDACLADARVWLANDGLQVDPELSEPRPPVAIDRDSVGRVFLQGDAPTRLAAWWLVFLESPTGFTCLTMWSVVARELDGDPTLRGWWLDQIASVLLHEPEPSRRAIDELLGGYILHPRSRLPQRETLDHLLGALPREAWPRVLVWAGP